MTAKLKSTQPRHRDATRISTFAKRKLIDNMSKEELARYCDIALLPRWMRVGFQSISRIERTFTDYETDIAGVKRQVEITTVGIELKHNRMEVGVFSDSDYDYHEGSPSSEYVMLALRYFMFRGVLSVAVGTANTIEQGMANYKKVCDVAEREWGIKADEPFISSQFNPKDPK